MTALETAIEALKNIAKEGPGEGAVKTWGPGNAHWCRDKAMNALKTITNAKRRDSRATVSMPKSLFTIWKRDLRSNTPDQVSDQKARNVLIYKLRELFGEDE